jgi:hypothetical protein
MVAVLETDCTDEKMIDLIVIFAVQLSCYAENIVERMLHGIQLGSIKEANEGLSGQSSPSSLIREMKRFSSLDGSTVDSEEETRETLAYAQCRDSQRGHASKQRVHFSSDTAQAISG